MAYNPLAPADNQFLADFPPEMREQLRAIIEDAIVNALKLSGKTAGNASGNIPINNGTLCVNLNADQLDGHDASYFSADGHVHATATQSSDGFMSNADKTKLDSIATNAEVNQNAFSNIAIGDVTIQADGTTDTLTLEAGGSVVLTPDATNDKVTISVEGDIYLPLSGGTVTGITTFNEGIKSTASVPLKVITTYNDGTDTTCESAVIAVNTSNSSYGNNIALGGGGNTVVGGGESYSAQLNALAGNSNEDMYVCADGTVYIKPNCNTFANAKTFAFTTDGKLQFPDGSKIWVV